LGMPPGRDNLLDPPGPDADVVDMHRYLSAIGRGRGLPGTVIYDPDRDRKRRETSPPERPNPWGEEADMTASKREHCPGCRHAP
jgi:hypothetical protein